MKTNKGRRAVRSGSSAASAKLAVILLAIAVLHTCTPFGAWDLFSTLQNSVDSGNPDVALSSSAPDPTNVSPIPITITFDEAVTGFAAVDLTVGNGAAGPVAGGPTVYTCDITPTAAGAVTVDIAAGVCQDLSGNPSNAASQLSRTYDSGNPGVTLSSSAPEPTNTSPIPITITFTEAVTGFTASDLTVGNGTAGTVAGGPTVYNCNITPSGQGSVTIDVAASVCQDLTGNPNNAASQLSRTYDSVKPGVSLTSAAPDPTSVSPIPITITFDEAVTGFAAGDLTVGNGTAGVVAGGPTVYTCNITPTAAGAVTVDIAAGVCQDLSGNTNNAAPSSLSRTYLGLLEMIQPGNWGTLQAFLNFQAAQGVTAAPTANYAIISAFTSNKWIGGVLAPNGKIYCMPNDREEVLIVDPATDTADLSTIVGLGAQSSKWIGGVLAPNSKIYGVPFNADHVLIIDPATDTADVTSIAVSGATGKWQGGVLGPNGKIYGIPCDASSVLIIDPAAGTADTTTITGLAGAQKWYGGVLAPNGKIYGIPWNATSVLIIDPVAGTADTTTISGLPATANKWAGGVLAPNGQIYCIPRDAEEVLIIDPASNTVDTTSITGLTGTDKWSGGALSPDGRIYGIPRNASSVLIIDPTSNSVDTTTINVGFLGIPKWVGGVLALNGKIYGIPRDAITVLIIDPKSAGAFSANVTLCGYFNKF